MKAKLPQWTTLIYMPAKVLQALQIAWDTLDSYTRTHEGKEAEIAMRKIRRLGK